MPLNNEGEETLATYIFFGGRYFMMQHALTPAVFSLLLHSLNLNKHHIRKEKI